MKAIDLIIKLQQLPPNMEVMIDISREDPNSAFHFVALEYADQIGLATGGEIIALSRFNLDGEEE
jgi:hypothetical protein